MSEVQAPIDLAIFVAQRVAISWGMGYILGSIYASIKQMGEMSV